MTFSEIRTWLEKILTGDEITLAETVRQAGFTEPTKTATNLVLLQEIFTRPKFVINIAKHALTTADPDLALNNLERLCGTVKKERLTTILSQPITSNQLLTILGASPFLAGLLCRRARFFEGLFVQSQIEHKKTEEQMCIELRQLITDEADTATLHRGLRIYKGQEMLRIGGRDLCGIAELEEVTDELSSLAAATLQRAFEVCSVQLQSEYGLPIIDSEHDEGQEVEIGRAHV